MSAVIAVINELAPPIPPVSIESMVKSVLNEPRSPQQAKTTAISALLANIDAVNLFSVCESLGWVSGSDNKPPAQKHIKVAVIHTLIETAKRHNWHVIHDSGFFYIFNGAYWVVLLDSEVKQLLKDAAIKMGYTEIESRDALFIDKLFQQAIQDGFFTERNIIKQSIINLKNGSLVLSEDGMTLKPFDYKDFLTHQLDFSHAPLAKNKLFLKYLNEVLPEKDTQRTLQEVAGYLFVKGLKMEKIFFLYGTGANGKSVFFEVLSQVIGKDNISNYSLESLTDDRGYHRAMIKDKILNYGTDIKLTRIDAGVFKTLASGEPVEARLPYREPFIMDDYAKLVFNVNRLDSANIEHTHGFYRRLLIIPFNQTISDDKQDKDLHKKILHDRAGILNWIIEGAERVIKSRNIFISAECEAFKLKFIKETDSVAMYESNFLEEEDKGMIYFKTVTEAYIDYLEFCRDAGHKHPLGRNNFSVRMEAIGFSKLKKTNGWHLEKNYLKKEL
jgi:putative DNA primase/helicase